jgi:7-cyano-7-deazaguanine synthase
MQLKSNRNNKDIPMTKKAFVLLSGGLDSTTCLHQAIMDYMPEDPGMNLAYGDKQIWKDLLQSGAEGALRINWVEAVSISYGQRHKKEMEYAAKTCSRLGIKHSILNVGSLLRGDHVMLTEDSRGIVDVPNIDYADIKGVSPTYVPFRNGLMLSALTAHAQKWVNEQNKEYNSVKDPDKPMAGIYFGAHAEDANNWAYPDCTPEFIGAMANAIFIGSYMQIRLHTPLEWATKSGVVTLGQSLGVRFKDTWSCYKGEKYHCGTCPTCRSRKQGFEAAKVEDPTEYAA